MKILVTGSSGYIGQCFTEYVCDEQDVSKDLVFCTDRGERTKNKSLESYRPEYRFCQASIGDEKLANFILDREIDTIFHFAAKADVADSTVNPMSYFKDNVSDFTLLMSRLIERGWKGTIINSSSAAVYGNYDHVISEHFPLAPVNAYGSSKVMVENILKELWDVHGITSISLRYFNVVGNYKNYFDHYTSGHIFQKILYSYDNKIPFKIFGTDYPTPDGTCVRDYISIFDVMRANFFTFMHHKDNPGCFQYNVSTGRGVSIKQVIDTFELFLQDSIMIEESYRRAGDPISLVGHSGALQRIGWRPKRSRLDKIIGQLVDKHRGKNAN